MAIGGFNSVCVYCGSSDNVDPAYKAAAKDLGNMLAQKGVRVVFGGGDVGLMGIVATSALNAGGEVHGIIPEHIAEKEIAHISLTKLDVVKTMHERKTIMVDNSDAFVILPGGLGTMDEFFEAFTWWQLGLHDKPIIIANIEGYWDPLLVLLNHLIEKGFARDIDSKYLITVNSVEEIAEVLLAAQPSEKALKSDVM